MAESVKKQDEIETEPVMGAITDRQLLVDMAQKLSGLVTTVRELTTTTSEGFEQSANRDLSLAARVTTLESRTSTLEGRLDSSKPSKHDLDAQAALAAESEKREALAKKVDALDAKTDAQTKILERIEAAAVTWWTSPTGKIVRAAAWGAVVAWAIKNHVHIPGIN